MNNSSSCPVFVDGAKVCEADEASYTVESPVAFHGSGLPGSNTVAEQNPPEYTVTLELSDRTRLWVDHTSRVEVAFPPDTHDGQKWHVIEVWEINEFEQNGRSVTLHGWDGAVHRAVSHLGDDLSNVETEQGSIELDESSEFEADIRDI